MADIATTFKAWLDTQNTDYFEMDEDSHHSVEFSLFFDHLEDGCDCVSSVSAYTGDPNVFSIYVRFPLSLEVIAAADLSQLVDDMNRNFDIGAFYSVSISDNAGKFSVVEFRLDTITTGVELQSDAFDYIMECLADATDTFIDTVVSQHPYEWFSIIDFSPATPEYMRVIEGGKKAGCTIAGERKPPALSIVGGKRPREPEKADD